MFWIFVFIFHSVRILAIQMVSIRNALDMIKDNIRTYLLLFAYSAFWNKKTKIFSLLHTAPKPILLLNLLYQHMWRVYSVYHKEFSLNLINFWKKFFNSWCNWFWLRANFIFSIVNFRKTQTEFLRITAQTLFIIL